MAKRDTERAPLTERYEHFVKKGKFEIGGMQPDGDPASIPENKLWRFFNGRLKDGGIVPRGGLDGFSNGALDSGTACISAGVDFKVSTPLRLYVLGVGCPGFSSTVGYSLQWFDPEQTPTYQGGVYYNTGSQNLVAGLFGKDLYVGQDNKLRKFQLITTPYGDLAISLAGFSQDIPLKRFDGYTKITWIQEFDGKLFIGLDSGSAGTSKIVMYDGTEFIDDLTGIEPVTGMMLWRDKLIAGYAGTPNEIRVRATGDAPGTWATVAPGAGTVRFYKYGESFLGTAYFVAGTTGDIWGYDGTTLAVARNVAGATFEGLAVHNRLLYAGDSTGANAGRILMFDGTTWQDTHKSLGALIQVTSLRSYRGDLIAGTTIGGTAVTLYRSPGSNTAGTYTAISNVTPSGSITQMLVA